MSSITFCDLCDVELKKGKGIYHVNINLPGESWHADSYSLCRKCAKPLIEWREANPRLKGTS